MNVETQIGSERLEEALHGLSTEDQEMLRLVLKSMDANTPPLNVQDFVRREGTSFRNFYVSLDRALSNLRAELAKAEGMNPFDRDLSLLGTEESDMIEESLLRLQRPTMIASLNTDDALWSMQAWSELQDRPEFQQYVGKFVAVYGRQVVLSGDDPTELLRQAADRCGVTRDLITIDFWGE